MFQETSHNLHLLPNLPYQWIKDHPVHLKSDRRYRELLQAKPTKKLSIIIPFRNELRSVESFLVALDMAKIHSYPMPTTLIFVQNGCTDGTDKVLTNWIHVKNSTRQTQNLEILHLTTPIESKANALNIANEVALQSNSDIAISLDMDNYCDINTIPELYLALSQSDASLITGTTITQPRRIPRGKLKDICIQYTCFNPKKDEAVVNGMVQAWKPRDIKDIGGFPHVIGEDYATGLLLRSQGKTHRRLPEAKVWGYRANTFEDKFKQLVRGQRSLIQLRELYPHLRDQIQNDMPATNNLLNQVTAHWHWASKNYKRIPFALINMPIIWAAQYQAKRQHQEDPYVKTWTQIESTR